MATEFDKLMRSIDPKRVFVPTSPHDRTQVNATGLTDARTLIDTQQRRVEELEGQVSVLEGGSLTLSNVIDELRVHITSLERDKARIELLLAKITSAPFPLHDYVTTEQWAECCNLYHELKDDIDDALAADSEANDAQD